MAMAMAMASSPAFKRSLLFLLLVAVRAHARESRFFSRASRAEAISPTSSPARSEQGYGLLGKEEYPTKVEYGAGERQGMSDTRFMEGGRYFYDINSDREAEGHGSFYGHAYDQDAAGGRQGMSDTRYMAKGRYFYDVNSVPQSYQGATRDGHGEDNRFRTTPNKFPEFEFDSMDEYNRYQQGQSHQQQYEP